MNPIYTPWTKEELAIVNSELPLKQLAALLPNRTKRAVATMRSAVRKAQDKPRKRAKKQVEVEAYTGGPRKLYQFISLAEATPERVKQW